MIDGIDLSRPTHALHVVDNWDGEGDRYYLLAVEYNAEFYSLETGNPVLQHVGDEVLKSWPLNQ